MGEDVTQRIDDFGRRLDTLTTEFEELKRQASLVQLVEPQPVVVEETPAAPQLVVVEKTPGAPEPYRVPARVAPWPAARPVAKEATPSEPLDLSWLMGPRGLAISGGVVTLLGIVFFFVLAVHRGWIGPGGRVALGALASMLVYGGGLELRRRYGATDSALAAVGTGLAGGYATLLFATAMYDMLPPLAALAVAAGIASVGVATSLRWDSQLVAGFALLGATLVPLGAISHGHLNPLGTAFAGIVFAATAIVATRKSWRALLIAGGIASAVQVVALIGADIYRHQAPARILAIAAFFATVYAVTGIARQLRSQTSGIDPLASGFTILGAVVAVDAAGRLFATSEQRGFAILAVALGYGVAGGYFLARSETRDLSALLTFVTFTLGAIAVALILNGEPLAYAWAAEAAALAWLSRRVREIRFQAWASAYLALAAGHVLAIDDPPRRLVTELAHPAVGIGTAFAVAAAALVFAFYAGQWREEDEPEEGTFLAGLFAPFALFSAEIRGAAAWLALTFATYGVSLATLALVTSFAWATVAITAIWMAVGIAILAAGFQRRSLHLRIGALVWLGLTGLLAVVQAFRVLDGSSSSIAFTLVGAAALCTSIGYGTVGRDDSGDAEYSVACFTPLIALGLFIQPAGAQLDGRAQGAALLGLAALYAALSTLLYRRKNRDLGTLYWAVAVGVAVFADVKLLHGTYAVLGWSVAGVALAWLAVRVREPRLLAGSGTFLVLATGRALAVQAPLTHLFREQTHPAYGTASVFAAAAAIAGAAYLARHALERFGGYGAIPWWIAGALSVYGVSLLILEFAEGFTSADLHTRFQRGQTSVSAFWGLLGLALLYIGLKRNWRAARIAGLAFFPIALAKIFLYDLSTLSNVTRALSFLAVGFVLLLGGFFYQRLTADEEEPPPATTVR
jgi:uncharacterized membrane protein